MKSIQNNKMSQINGGAKCIYRAMSLSTSTVGV